MVRRPKDHCRRVGHFHTTPAINGPLLSSTSNDMSVRVGSSEAEEEAEPEAEPEAEAEAEAEAEPEPEPEAEAEAEAV